MDIYNLEKVRNFSILLSTLALLVAAISIFGEHTSLGQLIFAPVYYQDSDLYYSIPPIVAVIFVLLSLLFGLIAYILHTLIHSH